MRCYKFEIFGAVQGVGFRPFVYKIATSLDLLGEVYNDSEGVKVILLGNESKISQFEKILLNTLPPLARIDKIEKKELPPKTYKDFTITSSKTALQFSPILPDYAICDDCKREFYDKKNPRYNYPFINCTNCGPRLSIIKSLPYDRKNTTMDEFTMCELCSKEYKNPLDRRYHAQPISCPNCGPTLSLKDKFKNTIAQNKDAIKQSIKLLKDGKILAIKGMGGFHLVCDALNENSIKILRDRKNRPSKPFAIMCEDEKMASEFSYINEKESEILNSSLKPIVVLKSKENGKIPSNLAPNLDKIGIFLANTGLHLLIFKYLKKPIIATSANLSGEPIIFNEDVLLKKQNNIIDYYLDNDRQILTPSDDSIVQIIYDKTFFLRTSRGINPKIFISNFKKKGCFLALGAELKNQFVIYKDGQIFISPYIGDLKNIATFERFKSLLNMFVTNYSLKFDSIVADLHPNFIHTKYFQNKNYKIYRVQHHYAHLISALYDNDLIGTKREFLGICFDGTGYGDDKTIWGGEIFKFNEFKYERLYNFDEFLLLGGEASIKHIDRLVFSILKKYEINDSKFLSKYSKFDLANLEMIYQKKINSFKTSSLGRVFDAFYSFVFQKDEISYDGQAGMEIEAFYDENIKDSYEFKLKNSKIIFKDIFSNSLNDDKVTACSKFINGICDMIVKISLKEKMPIVLSGGVFQNKTLVKKLIKEFKKNDLEFYFNTNSPTNDSGIALGQMIWYLNNN